MQQGVKEKEQEKKEEEEKNEEKEEEEEEKRKRRRKVKGRRRKQVTGALQLDLRDAGRPFPDMRFVKTRPGYFCAKDCLGLVRI